MIDDLILSVAQMWLAIGLFGHYDDQKYGSYSKNSKNSTEGGSIMFDKKTMKKIKFERVSSYLVKGEAVFLVAFDGSLVQITDDIDMETLFFHNLRGGFYAVYRKPCGLGSFNKSIKVGRWTFTVDHEEKEDAYDECRES